MRRIRSRLGFTAVVAGFLVASVGFEACSDALVTDPPANGPRLEKAIPVAAAEAAPSPIIVAAGDIADCNSPGDEATARLLDSLQFDALLALGDLAYEDGTALQFDTCYNATWGRYRAKTRPTPGNHEYYTPGAEGYFGYFGAIARPTGDSYYSFDLGGWHILSLNSNISASPGSAQLNWVRQDLAANSRACSLAFWHHPVISSGKHGNVSRMLEAWRVLDSAGVDVVLTGHDHNYERFAPQTATGLGIATGIREFVVGTGGREMRAFSTIRGNSELRGSNAWGVLKLTLNPTSYEWEFVPVAGQTFSDRGTADCVQTTPPEPNQPPVATLTAPSEGATFAAPATITLTATASDADGNLLRVDFYRGNTLIGSDATAPYSITWRNAEAGSYVLTARAADAAEAWTKSNEARVTVTAPPPPGNNAPTVSLTAPADNATFTAPATITLTAAASDPDAGDAVARVEFLNGTTVLGSATTSPYSFTWTNVAAGTYTLTARAVDGSSAAGTSAPAQVTVNAPPASNSPPSLSLTAPSDGATLEAPATITLEASASDVDGNLSRVEFYQGSTLLGTDATEPYAFTWSNVAAGHYTLTARAVDAADAATTSNEARVTVNPSPSNQAPVAHTGGPYTGPEGVTLTLNGSGSTDPENGQLTYAWSFGDGTTGTGVSPSKTYADNGTYTVTLVVSDPSGASHAAATTATIANVAPRATFPFPTTLASGEGYTLAVTKASDVAADQPGLQYRFECAGDGFTPWGAASSMTCPGVAGPSTHVIRAAIRDKDGGMRQQSRSVEVLGPPPAGNSAPTVSLTAPADNAAFTAPATITLEATASDVDGNLSRVEFYQGTTLLGSDATSPYSFTWSDVPAGSYTLTARAIDAAAATSTSTGARVTVNAPPPPNQTPVANPGGPYTGSEAIALTLHGGGSTDPESDPLTYAWDFGDGTTASGPSPAKTYADNGTYTVTLVVSDPSGARHAATTTAAIANVAPTGTFMSPATAASGEPYTLAITNAADVAADQLAGLEYRFECGVGYTPWGPFSSATCPGVIGPATRVVRGAVRDKDGGVRQQSRNLNVLAP